jgi:hypothetical protein
MKHNLRSVPQRKSPVSRRKRYSLRTLFFVSGAIAVPFLLMTNLRHSVRPEETVASPLYLLLGIAGVVFAAAIGSALSSRTGMFAAAGLAAFSWIALVCLCGIFSKELMAVLPVHVIFAAASLVVLAAVVWSARQPEVEGPHDMLLKLLTVKHNVRDAQQAKNLNSNPAESSIENTKSQIRN